MHTTKNHDTPAREATQRPPGEVTARELAPRLHWSEMHESEHFVQFYETDEALLQSLSTYIGAGLHAGEAGIVVATKEHRDGLEARLEAYGLDPAGARASGQYVVLDAAETLASFMIDGSPEPGRFAEVTGGIIAQATANGRRVRIFGEMVALLWAEGNHHGAIRLEELWNTLHDTRSFLLFCAYPISAFDDAELAEPLRDVCATHSRVIPSESYTALTSPDERLREIVLLQQKASLLEAEIEERKRAEAALRAVKDELEVQLEEREQLLTREQIARAEAEHANRMKDEFLATVSHELRTPLTTIIGWAQVLRNGLRNGKLDEARLARALEVIEKNAASQAQLVEDILDVSRVITGRLRLDVGPVDAAAVINAAIDSVQLAADSKGIQLVVTLDPSARRISGDAGRLQQVVWNLLANAIKFTPSGGQIDVRLERAGSDVQISVSDTGQGISADFLPFIFDRFRQADGTSTRQNGGLGLGLAIVRHLVELHGGTAHADSPGAGQGATFTVRLPLATGREHANGGSSDSGRTRPTNETTARVKPPHAIDGLQVLLVDDDRDTLQMLTTALCESRARVHAAASVAEATEALQWCQPDVLVCDLAMPGEDGHALIGKLRAREAEGGKHIPAVALTAYARVEDRVRALSAGFDMFVPKPVDLNELIAAVANLAEPGTSESART